MVSFVTVTVWAYAYLEVSLVVEHEVLRLEVAVGDAVGVKALQRQSHTRGVVPSPGLLEVACMSKREQQKVRAAA